MLRRIERVNEMLTRLLAQLVAQSATGELPIIAVDRVETAANLRSAKVYVSAIGNHQLSNEIIQFLESKRPEFQQAIAKIDNLKFTPVLDFQISHFDENAQKVEQLIDQIHES